MAEIRKYECVAVLNDKQLDDNGQSFIDALGEAIKEYGGELESSESLGKRELAAEVDHIKSGQFWAFYATLPANKVKDLKARYKRDSKVIRLEVFVFDPKQKEASELRKAASEKASA
jgi:ribosomal protein S6